MFLKKSFVVLGMASMMFLQGCTNTQTVENVVSFKLYEGIKHEDLKGYVDTKTSFYGYMSIDHLDSDYIIVTFNPEGLCPFHGETDNSTYTSIPVKLKDVNNIPANLYVPVKVEGVIKTGEFKDGDSHVFDVIVDEAVLTPVKENSTNGILKNYINIAEKGIFSKIREQQVAIDEALGNKMFGKELEDLKKIDLGELEYAREVAFSIKDGSTDDLIKAIDSAIEIGTLVNEALDKKDLTLLANSELIQKTYAMFETYQRWQLKYSV